MVKKILLLFLLTCAIVVNISAITAREIVERIIKKAVNAPFPQTVDVFKEGNPDAEVTGIAVCMFASMDVLRDAVKNNCNFIITHEPLYYNHLDATSQFKDDLVVNEKRKFITENHLIVWRFHDYLHSLKPDPVLTAMADKLGWKDYCSTSSPYEYTLPATTLKAVISHLKKKIPGVSFDVVGKPTTKISKVVFAPGSPGSMTHIRAFNEKNADLVIGGEVQQWETYEYVRDAVAQNRNKAVIFLGHIPSEDPGMEATPKWLKTFISEVPVKFLESGPSYVTY